MTTSTYFTLITILSVGVFTQSFADNCKIFYVKPENSSETQSGCPSYSNCTCLTLNDYAQNAWKFFPNGSNTTLLFLAGNHILNTTLTINSTTSHLARENTTQALSQTIGSRIHCSNAGNILFNVQSASITGLNFFSCRPTYKTNEEVINIQFSNSSFNEGSVSIIGSGDPTNITGIYCILEVKSDAIVTFNGTGNLYLKYCNATISGSVQFLNNSAATGGGIAVVCDNSQNVLCTLKVDREGILSFLNNSAHYGGAMNLVQVNIQLQGKICLENNSADQEGGAMYLRKSVLYFWPTALLTISNNHAGGFGGAIYIDDTNPYSYCLSDILAHKEDCFFQVVGRNVSQQLDVQMVFSNNSAKQGGDILYGGAIDHCTLKGNYCHNDSGVIFHELTNITEDNASISSDPFKIRHCKETESPCYLTAFAAYPGQMFNVSIVAVGQHNGTAQATIQANDLANSDLHVALANSDFYQQSYRWCTNLNYTMTLFASKVEYQTVDLLLSVKSACSYAVDPLVIRVEFQPCPTGFNLSKDTGSCICEDRLQKYTHDCDINSQKIGRNGTFWVGYDNASNGLILNPNCPFDYCKSKPVNFSLNETCLQCDHNRTLLLCGACVHGWSHVLGSSQCMHCSNFYLFLLVPFAVAGFVLVVLILACKLTVAAGTISGLLFYANIIAVNRAIFLPNGFSNVLTVFLAWLNLDLGIETCFYDGMDAYDKAWLQFVFPLYLWCIIASIMVISKFSVRISRLLGSNPIAALATLLFLSKAKILRAIISVLSFTELEYLNHTQVVWRNDANVSYFRGKHVPLFVSAVVIIFVFLLPYTLVLLFGHWLQTKSHLRVISWIKSQRVKFYLDAHYAPYKDKHRYWPGLLRFVKCVLLITTALVHPNVALLLISAVTFGITTWIWYFGRVFKLWYLNALEGSFILNLGILAAGTQYIKHERGNQAVLTCTSIGVALVTFIGIVIYHIYLQVQDTKLVRCVTNLRTSYIQERQRNVCEVELSRSIGSQRISKYVDFSRLRESLLEPQIQ